MLSPCTPKVCAYDEVNGNLTLKLYSIPWGNEAEILTIAILGENKFFVILGGSNFGGHFRGNKFSERLGNVVGKNINFLVGLHERMEDVFRGNVKFELNLEIRVDD